jgi:hypothetical protein
MGGSTGKVEAVQPPGGFRPAAVHPLHVRCLWTTLGRLLQPLEVRPAPLGDELDGSVVSVAHPAAQAEAPAFPHQEPAKANPLHVAMNQAV